MRTPFMTQFHQKLQNDVDDELDSIRRSKVLAQKAKKANLEALELSWQLTDMTMVREDVIVVGPDAIEFIDQYLQVSGNRTPDGWTQLMQPKELPEVGIWVEFEDTIGREGWPFEIKALQLSELGKRGFALLGVEIPAMIRERFDREVEDLMWELDVVNAEGHIEFSSRYSAIAKEWDIAEDSPKCPFDVCTTWKGKRCKTCNEVRMMSAILLAMVLAAARGEFQEVEYRESSSIASESKESSRMSRNCSEQARKSSAVIVKRIDVHNKVKYVKPDCSENSEHRLSWRTLHNEDEIETVKKVSAGHIRRYRDGRVVDVKPSKPRNYWRLKNEHVTRLD